jgi:hypothetical protein
MSNRILSIDVGIKNLAMCLIEERTKLVLEWDVSGVPPQHADGLFRTLIRHLDAKPWTLTAKTILIEKQPGQNKTMKSVENLLHVYFLLKCPTSETIIYDARHKVPDVVGRGKVQYRKRKQAAIDRCRLFLNEEPNRHWRENFIQSQKKDDLADTVMQALSYIERWVPASAASTGESAVTAPIKPKKLIARKPNEHQKDTRYSQCNLAWMVKNTPEDQLMRDKRFLKDLRRYYQNFDELKTHCNV